MSLVTLLVALLIWCLVAWAVRAILSAFGIGEPIRTVVHVILVILFILWVLSIFGLVRVPIFPLR